MIISLDRLTTGMVLNAPAVNDHGQTILPALTVLQQEHILKLRQWGVHELDISATGEEESLKRFHEHVQKAEGVLEPLFRWNAPDHPFVGHIRRLAAERHAFAQMKKEEHAS